jgi:hypothetical protein
MPRLTITISDEHHLALKEAAVRQGKTIRQIIEESLDLRGLKSMRRAADIVREVRGASDMDEESAQAIALEETREVRGS